MHPGTANPAIPSGARELAHRLSTGKSVRATFVLVSRRGTIVHGIAMAEVIRISGSEPPATPSLPQNIEAEAALLGALMIDNRLVEDVQIRLRSEHFFEPLHGRIYDAILRMTDRNMVANPVTLKPMFESDEGIKEVGGPSYLAQLTGSGAAVIGARDFAQQIYDLALLRALIGVGRDLVEGALD